MLYVFKIDDKAYPTIHVVSLKRKFSVADGSLSARNMDGEMIRDVIGTFYNYELELKCTDMSQTEYDEFYEVISAPDDSHKLELPYGQHMFTFDAYISSGDDELKLMTEDRGNFWRGLTCSFIAMKPARRPIG